MIYNSKFYYYDKHNKNLTKSLADYLSVYTLYTNNVTHHDACQKKI